jgi:D-alanyl-D-alanine carboxypeptidase
VLTGSLAGCTDDRTARASSSDTSDDTSLATTSVAPVTSVPVTAPTTSPPIPVTSIPVTILATSVPVTSVPVTSVPVPSTPSFPVSYPVSYPQLEAAVFGLALDNVAVSVSVHRDGVAPWGIAAGRRADGQNATTDSPFVVASVSKLVTALSIARLVEIGSLTTDTEIPWGSLGLTTDPLWADVTVRELLDHTSGMPINRKSWLDDPGPCSVPLQEALLASPTIARTTWQYSNGNYCALGLLVESITGRPLDEAAYDLVFTPAGVTGPYLSTEGLRRDSVPSPRGIARLERLGGAGTWLASTDDLVAILDTVTPEDLDVLSWPGIIVDQYGWGHTGTVDGAKACAWVLEDGRTTVAAVVSGPKPATGGDVCDAVLPALALDLGVWAGDPLRNPV